MPDTPTIDIRPALQSRIGALIFENAELQAKLDLATAALAACDREHGQVEPTPLRKDQEEAG